MHSGQKAARGRLQLSNRPHEYFLYGDHDGDSGLDTLNIEAIRDRSLRHDWVILPHRHPSHIQLLLFTGGGATIGIEGQVLRPCAPSVAVHPAGMVHEIRYAPMTEGLTITVASAYVDRLLDETPGMARVLSHPGVFDFGPATDDIVAAFRAIDRENRERAAGWRVAMRGHFLTILTALFRLEGARNAMPSRRDHELARAFARAVEERFRLCKRLSDYARDLAISPQRLNAACNSATGASASRILHERIMVEAKRALAYSEMTVAEIGHDLGFDDPAYFSRFFSHRSGLAPGQWRARFTATEIARLEKTVE